MRKILVLFLLLFLVGCGGTSTDLEIVADKSISLQVGEEKQTSATIKNGEGQLLFKTLDESIITVSENGLIKALKEGETTIEVSIKDTDIKLIINVVVTAATADNITIGAEDIVLIIGETITPNITHNDPEGIMIEISDGDSISIEGDEITGLKAGITTLKIISQTNKDYFIEIKVDVKDEFIHANQSNFDVTLGDTLDLEINASGDYDVSMTDDTILTFVDQTYVASKIGTTTITYTLKDYPTIKAVVTVSVYPVVTIEVDDVVELFMQQQITLAYTSNETLTLSSSDETVFSVEGNVLTGVKGGAAKLLFSADANPSFSHEIDVVVAPMPTRITLTASRSIVLQETTQIVTNFTPVGSYSYLTYQTSDESVLTIDDEGVVTGVGIGEALITVTSTIDARVKATIRIKVERINAVKPDLQTGETVVANGFTFIEGVNVFKTLEEALVDSPKEVILIGAYDEAITINEAIVLSGTEETTISKAFTIASDGVTVRGMTFIGAALINVSEGLNEVLISNNTFKTLTHSDAVIHGVNQSNISINYNTFNLNEQVAIHLENPSAELISIKGNTINNATTAIMVKAEVAYNKNLSLQIGWNKIDSVLVGFDIDLSYADVYTHANSYIRFNEVTNYQTGAKASLVNLIDYNLNYWGGEPDYDKFVNLGGDDLDGYYLDPSEIIDESDYNPKGPSFLKILNDITEVNIKDVIEVEYKVLPRDVPATSVRLLTSDSNVMIIRPGNKLSFKRSGFVELILTSVYNEAINDKIRFEIITDPGIEIIPESSKNNLFVGDTLQLNTTVFPYRISDTPVTFSVDDPTIATINTTGLLTAVSTGLVTVTAKLHNDEDVLQTFKVEVLSPLDPEHNIMDMITASIMTYTEKRSLTMYGGTDYIFTGFDSVSRLIFEDLVINRSMMIPDCDSLPNADQVNNCKQLRPGVRPSMIEGLETYNNKNVHYVTVHETANTNANHGAYSHANYLLNQVKGTTALRQASWHFTVDDKAIYQHIETDEMAWHAGDGSRKAGTTWTDEYGNHNIGGGNTHSVGIETSVASSDDIFKIWHRTAKLSADLTKLYNLPESHVKFHQDFSSKWCPQSMLRANLTWVFREMVYFEYLRAHTYEGAIIELTSHNPEFVDSSGRVIKMPDRAQNVSFTIKVTYNGEVMERTYYSYLPGTVH